MTTEKKLEEVPLEFQTHNKPTENVSENFKGNEVPLEFQTHHDQPTAKSHVNSPVEYPENKRLLDIAAGVGGGMTATGLMVPSGLYKKGLDLLPLLMQDPSLVPGGLHRYINGNIGNIGGEITAKDLAKATGMPRVQTFSQAQEAIHRANPKEHRLSEKYHMPTTEGIDLSQYAVPKNISTNKPKLDLATNIARTRPVRGVLGGYNAMDAVNQDNPLQTGIALTGTAGALAPYAEPLLPTKIRQKTLPKQLGGLAALGAPIINLILDQFKEDPEKDIGVLGKKADGGVVGYSGGRSVSDYRQEHTAQAYDPSYSEQIKDYAKKFLTKEQADAIFGGPTVGFVDSMNPISQIARLPGNLADAGANFIEHSKRGQYFPAMGNVLGAALDVVGTGGMLRGAVKGAIPRMKASAEELEQFYKANPLMRPNTNPIRDDVRFNNDPVSKVATATGKMVLKELGPKFGEMSEDFLHRVGALHPITAYHGTPHKVQGGFDLAKVGTGEGNQTFGHGMYFAEKPDVAKGYQERLSRFKGKNIPEEDLNAYFSIGNVIDKRGIEGKQIVNYDPTTKQATLKPVIKNAQNEWVENPSYKTYVKKLNPMIEDVEVNLGKKLYDRGNFYKVDIPDEQIPKMLDLDKSLAEQKHVWDALHPDVRNAIDDLMENQYRNPMSEVPEAYTGHNLYRALTHHDVGEVLPAEVPNSSWLKGDTSYEKHASQYLNSLGIPGIKYLDQGSRGNAPTIRQVTKDNQQMFEVDPRWHEPNKKYHFPTEAEAQAHANSYGTRNFVSFDPATVKILEENDVPKFADGGEVKHMQVGGLTGLIKLFERQGAKSAAQRLTKAADLVPNLEHQYQPSALKSIFDDYNNSAVMVMNPADFQKYAAPISAERKVSLMPGYRIGRPGPNQDYSHMPLGTYEEYLKYLQGISKPGGGGFESVPFLQLGQKKGSSFPNIKGHEGRHRTDALASQGEKTTLIGVKPGPEFDNLPRQSQEEFLNALSEKFHGGKSPFVIPEESEITRDLIELPEMFKKGGNVKKKK